MHIYFSAENRFICDCRLRWIFDLYNQTKNRDLKHSLERVKCTLESTHHVINDNTLNDPRYQIHFETGPHKVPMNIDVHNDLSLAGNGNSAYDMEQRRQQSTISGEKVELMGLNPNTLPCERVTDPTELPLQHEPVTGPDSWNILKGKLFKSAAIKISAVNLFATILLAAFTSVILA